MNILYVESGVAGGGSFESLLQHIKTVDRERFQPHVVFLNRTEYLQKLKAMNVPTVLVEDPVFSRGEGLGLQPYRHFIWRFVRNYCPSLYRSAVRYLQSSTIRRLESIVREHQIDLIHLNDQPDRDWFGIEAARRVDRPCVAHIRTADVPNFRSMGAQHANRTVDCYLANSRFVAERWGERGVDEDRVEVLYNAVEVEEVEPVDLRRLDIDPDSFVLVNASRPSGVKGTDFLLDALRTYRNRFDGDSLHLLMVGGRRGGPELEQKIKARGLKDMVTLTDWVDDAKPYIAASDALVVSSRMEGFGRVLLEAMMVETPIVATDVGGVPEVLEGGSGLLVEYGATEELAGAINELQGDPELRERLVQQGEKKLKNQFSTERYVRDIEKIYERILEDNR